MEKTRISWDKLETYEHEYETYSGFLFTGIAVEYYPDGKIRSEAEFVNGVRSGWTREWFPNGQVKYEEHYINLVLDGICREWYENGQLKIEKTVVQSIVTMRKEWNESGKLIDTFAIDKQHPSYELLQMKLQNRHKWLQGVKDWESNSKSIDDLYKESQT